jgi:hypothetical protein
LRLGNAPGGSHRAEWLSPFNHNPNSTRHFAPTVNPADAPAINAIANGDFSERPQKPSLNLQGDPCMALRGWTASRASHNFRRSIDQQIGSRVRSGAIWQVGLLFIDPTK